MVSLARKIEFKTLCQVFEEIMKNRGIKKIEIIQKFIQECRKIGQMIQKNDPSADISMFPIIRLFLVKIDHERGAHGLKEKALGNLYIRIFCLGKNTPEAEAIRKYREPVAEGSKINDFGETIYRILCARLGTSSTLTVENVNSILDKIAKTHAINEKKDAEFINFMQLCDGLAIKWITRLILKDTKLGLSEKGVLEAYHSDAARLYGEVSDLRKICDRMLNLNYKLEQNIPNIAVLTPFKPMLLERLSITDINKLFLNENQTYIVQSKFDGERCQIHMKSGKFKYYSRHGYDITVHEGYGEKSNSKNDCLTNRISALINPMCQSVILDGELMAWHKVKCVFGSKGMSFDVKKLSSNSSYQPCFVAFDIILYNDKLLLDVALIERLQILENVFQEYSGTLIRAKNTKISSASELLNIFNQSLDNREEGIVLKKSDGKYLINTRQNSNCYKIKAEYSDDLVEDIDMIILGGYYGEGKYSGLLNSFLMGIASDKKKDDTEEKIIFYSTVSVSSGLSMNQILQVNARLKPYWTKKCPDVIKPTKKEEPDFWIHPKYSIIFKLRATEIIRSSNQPTNYTLRFPRVINIREDKPWYNACTISEFNALIKSPGIVQKLTKRHANNNDIEKTLKKIKRHKIGVMNETKIDDKYFSTKTTNVSCYSRLFEGKTICVINGEEKLISESNKLTKVDIEKILLSHSAKIVQNPSEEIFCIIVGNSNTTKIQNLISCKKYDIATVDWLRRAIHKDNWQAIVKWYPWELLSFRLNTIEKMYEYFDEYYDSFVDDANNQSLIRSLDRVGTLRNKIDMCNDDYIKLEKKLFGNHLSGSFLNFRNIVGYFVDSTDENQWAFKFMRGIISDKIDNSVIYIFVNQTFIKNDIELYTKINTCDATSIKIVESRWIIECFEKNFLLPITEFLIT